MKDSSTRCRKAVALCCAILITGTSMVTMPMSKDITAEATEQYNYARGLQYSMYLYDANMCGTDVGETSALDWRDDCHTSDATATAPNGTTVDVSGGYHDAGDHVKFGLPQAYSASILGWGYYEFKDAYVQTGQAEHMETISTHFAEYFKNCTILDDYGNVVAFCYQVGDGNADHSEWCSPETQTGNRPTYWATSSNPATDIVSNTVGALAFHYKNFGDEEALKYAKALYNFARNNSKQVASDGIGSFYVSDSYIDDLMWAAAALYTVTGDTSYVSDANQFLNGCGDVYKFCSDWALCWGNMWPAVNLIFGRLDSGINNNAHLDWGSLNSQMMSQVEKTMSNFQNKTILDGTYVCFDDWGSARYNTAMQLVGLVYDKYNGTNKYGDWAKSQMDYLMGNNSQGVCYITGFSESSVTNPHHRAASGLSSFPASNTTITMAHTLVGGLVGGQSKDGTFIDQIGNYQNTEVAIDYNAGFVGAMAGLYLKYGAGQTVDDTIVGVDGVDTSSTPITTTTTPETTTVTDVSSTSTSETEVTTTPTVAEPTQVVTTTDTKVIDIDSNVSSQSNNTYHLELSDILEDGQLLESISFNISSYSGNIGNIITGFGISVVEDSPYGSNYWYDDPYGFQTTVCGDSTTITWTIPEGLRPYIQDTGKVMFGLWWAECGQVNLESVTANVVSKVTVSETSQDTTLATSEPKSKTVDEPDVSEETTVTTIGYVDTSDTTTTTTVSETEVTTTEPTTTVTTIDSTTTPEETTPLSANVDIVWGDANSDGQIRNNDVQLIRQYLLHMEVAIDDDGLTDFDVTHDSTIRNNDVQLVRQYLLHQVEYSLLESN